MNRLRTHHFTSASVRRSSRCSSSILDFRACGTSTAMKDRISSIKTAISCQRSTFSRDKNLHDNLYWLMAEAESYYRVQEIPSHSQSPCRRMVLIWSLSPMNWYPWIRFLGACQGDGLPTGFSSVPPVGPAMVMAKPRVASLSGERLRPSSPPHPHLPPDAVDQFSGTPSI
jgi:hypothetical protein